MKRPPRPSDVVLGVLALTCASFADAHAQDAPQARQPVTTHVGDMPVPIWIHSGQAPTLVPQSTGDASAPVAPPVGTVVTTSPGATPPADTAGLPPDAESTEESLTLVIPTDRKYPPLISGRLPFSLRFGNVESSLSTLSAFVLPGAKLDFTVVGGSGKFTAAAAVAVVGDTKSNMPATAGRGQLLKTGAASWCWTAPMEHGDHELRIRDRADGRTAFLRVFVMHPYDGSGKLGEYEIGQYVTGAKDGDPAYLPPEGFVKVSASNADTLVSPHFQLGQFLCKYECEFPGYLALRSELLIKLEHLLEILAEHGLPAPTLHVMSGYRTPAYNAGIGNETTMSRHIYGDAADVFLDRDEDQMQDDLNGDGRSTKADARILYNLVEATLDKSLPSHLSGGLAAYSPNHAHGPFLHIDTRGKPARW